MRRRRSRREAAGRARTPPGEGPPDEGRVGHVLARRRLARVEDGVGHDKERAVPEDLGAGRTVGAEGEVEGGEGGRSLMHDGALLSVMREARHGRREGPVIDRRAVEIDTA
jgi:hypothetical protein